jgi:ribosomal-protein-alanine N-acetyltransferase
MTLQINPMSLQDLPLIRDEGTFASWSRQDIERFIVLPTTKSWRGTINGQLAGLLLVSDVEAEIDILTIATLEDFRRRGIADALLQHLISYARETKVNTVFLEIKENNDPARALYEKWGFIPYGKRENYYQESNESVIAAILYRLDLNDLEKKNKIKLD